MRTLQRCEVQLNHLKQSLVELNASRIEISNTLQGKKQKEVEL